MKHVKKSNFQPARAGLVDLSTDVGAQEEDLIVIPPLHPVLEDATETQNVIDLDAVFPLPFDRAYSEDDINEAPGATERSEDLVALMSSAVSSTTLPPPADHSWAPRRAELDKYKYFLSVNKVMSNGEYWMADGQHSFSNVMTNGVKSNEKAVYTKIVGNDGDNVIHGMGSLHYQRNGEIKHTYDHDDLIYGGGGNDIIYGYSGNDRLFGNEGDDVIFGGAGNDYIDGGDGNDILFGGSGYDILIGGDGDDWLFSGPTVSISGTIDELLGIPNGADMYGGNGADTFVIGTGSEVVPVGNDGGAPAWPGTLAQILSIGSVFVPKLGVAKKAVMLVNTIADMFGMSKDSESIAGGTAGEHMVTKIRDFNPLEDKLMIPIKDPNNIDFYFEEAHNPNVVLVITDKMGNKIAEISFADSEAIFGEGVTSFPSKYIEQFVAQMISGAILVGKDGAFYGLEDQQKLDVDPRVLEELGDNNFLLMGAFGGQEFNGDVGTDLVLGTNYGDVITGYNLDPNAPGIIDHYEQADDVLWGFGGDDLFIGGGGSNTFYGGDGNDTVSYQYANRGIVADMMQLTENGYYEVLNGHMKRENQNSTDVEVMKYDKHFDIENIIGSDQDDIIYGDNNDNIFVSGGGNDELAGRGGADTFVLTGGTNTILDFSADEGDRIQIHLENYGLVEGGILHLSKVAFNGGTHLVHSGSGEVIAVLNGVDVDQFDLSKDVDLMGPNGDVYEFQTGTGNLIGTDANDILYATAGTNSRLEGGKGDDAIVMNGVGLHVYGGEGADAFIFGETSVVSFIHDFNADEGDTLWLDLEAHGLNSIDDLTFGLANGGVTIASGSELFNYIGTVYGSDVDTVRNSIRDISGSEYEWLV